MTKKITTSVFIIILICVGLYWFARGRSSIVPVVQPSPVSAATSTTDSLTPIIPKAKVSTEGWKTCRNDGYGYEFKYPGDWKLYNNIDTEKVKTSAGAGYMVQATATDKCIGNVSVSSFIQTGGPYSPIPSEAEKNNYFSVHIDMTQLQASTTEQLVSMYAEIERKENLRIDIKSQQTSKIVSGYIVDGKAFSTVQFYNYQHIPTYWRLISLGDDKRSMMQIYPAYNGTAIADLPAINETILSTLKFAK